MRADWKAAGGYGTLGLEIVLAVMFGFFGGRWLDSRLDTAPYLAVIGFFVGVAAAARFLWRATKRMQADTERDGFLPSHTGRVPRERNDDERS